MRATAASARSRSAGTSPSRWRAARVEAGPRTLWRFADFLPVAPPEHGLPVGCSPLIRADRLAAELGLDCDLYIKTETSNPTHSFKDRVVAVAAAKAVELGYEALACASTGNLAGATAAAGAALGLPTYIFVPSDLEREKIIAAAAYGATVFAVDGSYDDVNRLCSELTYDRPWAFVNVNMRAYYAEGSKTIALETAEQLGWRAPDRVVAPIASGSLYTKILQGFEQGRTAGLIAPGPAPVMHGAQGEGCAPVADGVRRGRRHGRAGAPDRDRQVARDRQPGRRRLRARRRPPHRRQHRVGHRRRDRRGHPPARPHHRHLHRDGRRRHHGRAARPGRAGRDRRGRDGGRVHHRRRAEDDRRGRAGAVETIAIPADPDAVDAALGAPAAR